MRTLITNGTIVTDQASLRLANGNTFIGDLTIMAGWQVTPNFAFQGGYDLCDLPNTLPDGDVNADDVATFLVDDGINGQGGFAGLPVADDKLALSTADGDHGVYGLYAGL